MALSPTCWLLSKSLLGWIPFIEFYWLFSKHFIEFYLLLSDLTLLHNVRSIKEGLITGLYVCICACLSYSIMRWQNGGENKGAIYIYPDKGATNTVVRRKDISRHWQPAVGFRRATADLDDLVAFLIILMTLMTLMTLMALLTHRDGIIPLG